MDIWRQLVELFREPLSLLFDPSERTYWLHLVAAIPLAAVVAYVGLLRGRGLTWDPRRWISRSARTDYWLIAVRPILGAVFVLPLTLTAFGLAAGVVSVLDGWFGPHDIRVLSPLQVTLVYSVTLFVAWDFSRFVLHRWMHRVSWLWEFHQVHHSADVLTPFTLHRVHPVESALYRLRGILVTGLLTGLFFHLFRRDAVELQLLGVNAIGFAFSLLGGNLRHSHVWWSWGERIERWFISPAQHQLHHAVHAGAADPRHPHPNYGTWLAIWDRLGGSHRAAGPEPVEAFGLPEAARNHDPHSVLSALIDPVWAVLRRLAAAAR